MKKLALVGRGSWGKNYIPFVKPENIKTRNYKELFGNKDLTSVIIASPTNTHFKIAKDFIKHGFNLLVEKPITQNHSEALILKKLARKHKVKIMAGHVLLYDEAYQSFKKLLSKIGRINYLEFIGLQSPVRKSSTLLLDWGPHPIYIFNDILKTVPAKVRATYLKNILNLKFFFSKKVQAEANLAWKYPKKIRLIKAVGIKGTLILDYKSYPKKITLGLKNQTLKSYYIKIKKSAIEHQIKAFEKLIAKEEKPHSHIDSAINTMKLLDIFSRQLQK